MKLTGFAHSSELLLSPLASLLPTELKASETTEASSFDVVISGGNVSINNLPPGITQTSAETLSLLVTHTPTRPLKVLVHRSATSEQQATLGELQISVAPEQNLQLEQLFTGSDTGVTVTQTRINLSEKAVLEHVIKIQEGAAALHAGHMHATLDSGAQLFQTFLIQGGKQIRLEVTATMKGEGAHAQLASLAELNGASQVELKSLLRHEAPHTSSKQLAKNLLNGHARGHFTGKVYIARGAQQVEAEQLNRNLLLSKTARAVGEPQLEIYADDVKCSHGSTTGQIEEEASFYLTSRGIDPARARALLTQAFVAEVLQLAPLNLRPFLQENL